MRELFAKSARVNALAAARVFLFGARDVRFFFGLPVFLYASGRSFAGVGGFLAAWTVAYGGAQAAAPAPVRRSADGLSREVPAARLWAAVLAAVPALAAVALAESDSLEADPALVAAAALVLFGLPFAVNSALHSYLILAYAGSKKAAEDVGFYYAANAAGRLVGTLFSGLLFQAGGSIACLVGSSAMLAACAAITFALPTAERARAVP